MPGDTGTAHVSGGMVQGPVIGTNSGNVTQYTAGGDIHVHNYNPTAHDQGSQTSSQPIHDFDPARFIECKDEIKPFMTYAKQ